MATRQAGKRISDTTNCPRCGGIAVMISAGKMVKWLTCTKCKYKTLLEKEKEDIKVTPLNTEAEMKKLVKL